MFFWQYGRWAVNSNAKANVRWLCVQTTGQSTTGQSHIDALLNALTDSLGNLSRPIKLYPPGLILNRGTFPKYSDEDVDFTALTQETWHRCIAVSHRWTNESNSRSDLDVKWLQDHWDKFNLTEAETAECLLFYDYSSLPQRDGNGIFPHAEDGLTFKAGLEMIDHIFSRKSIIIPTQGYNYRFWCYTELFICLYNSSRVSPLPFTESAPEDLKIVDRMIDFLTKEANGILQSHANHNQLKRQLAMYARSIATLGWQDKYILTQHFARDEALDGSSRRVFLHHVLEFRRVIVNVIEARLRQCTIKHKSDQPFLESLVKRYLEKALPTVDVIQEQYTDTRGVYRRPN